MIRWSWLRHLSPLLLALLGRLTLAAPLPQIGAEDDWYPYTALRDGEIRGMSADIVRAAFAAADTPVELIAYPYARCMYLARIGKLAGCFNTTPDEQVRHDFRLPRQALFNDDILIWARRSQATPLAHLADLSGRRIAVTLGYEYGPSFDGYSGVQRIAVRQDINGFRMLERGRVDYSIAFRGTSEQLFRDNPSLQGLFQPVYTAHQAELFLSFSREHRDARRLLQQFERGMQIIADNGRYRQILSQWQHQRPTRLKADTRH